MPKIQKFQMPTSTGLQYNPLTPAQWWAKKTTDYLGTNIGNPSTNSSLVNKKNPLFKNEFNINKVLAFSKSIDNFKFTMPSMENTVSAALNADTASPTAKKGTGFLGNLGLEKIGEFGQKNAEVLGETPAIVETGMKLAGSKEADTASGGEKLFQQATTTAFKGALKTGNPLLIAGTGIAKGLDLLNRYAGSTAKKQGTLGIDTGAYTTQISPNAGAKQTVLGSIGWKGKKSSKTAMLNKQTQAADRSNLLANRSAYTNTQNQLAAQNTYGDIASRNNQKLMGGIGTNILSAQKGAKLISRSVSTEEKPILIEQPKTKQPINYKYPSAFTRSYYMSPKFKERVHNRQVESVKARHPEWGPESENAVQNLAKMDTETYIRDSFQNLNRGQVFVGKDITGKTNYHHGKTGNIYVKDVYNTLPHELSHRNQMYPWNGMDTQYLDIFNRYIPRDGVQQYTKKLAEDGQLKREGSMDKAMDTFDFLNNIYDIDAGTHDIDPNEVKADIYQLRFNLFKNDIYDARKQDFGKDHYNKAKKLYGTDPILKRIFDAYTEDDFIYLMNTVADNKQNNKKSSTLYAKKGARINPKKLSNIKKRAQYKVKKAQIGDTLDDGQKLALGGKINVIPEGALHARKNNYEGELAEQVTSKGIPVITYEEDGKIIQHAEIENSEIIFHKEVTDQLESWFKEYQDADDSKKKELELECGKYLCEEILENTEDNVGLIEQIQ